MASYGSFRSIEEALSEIKETFPTYQPWTWKDRKGNDYPAYNRWISPDGKWYVNISLEFHTDKIKEGINKIKKYKPDYKSDLEADYLFQVNCNPVSNVKFLFRAKIRKFV